jgi:putative protease
MLPRPAPGAVPSRGSGARPEVLAPAGDWDCVRAAVENGADAVYFGLSKWNARARATNFTVEELPELMATLRLRGVRGYVAFNTLVFADELDEAGRALERIIAAGPDALILQDLGVARLARAISPDVELHASTQTTTTCSEQMAALAELGFSRVILARELSVKEIRAIAAASPMPVEVFVHGALCVAYSGQCLTSEALGGRSANRGACAQACRLPYDLVVDGRVKDLGEKAYLLSPQDLAAYDLVPRLADAGVAALKIEGRLKTPEYVAATTRVYRKAVDAAAPSWSRDEVLMLQQVFSRGLSHGFLDGIDHQALVPALSPKKRGPYLGTIAAIRRGRVAIRLVSPVKPGDGVSFDYGSPDDETGGAVYEIRADGRRVPAAEPGDEVELSFGPAVDWSRVHEGDRVWKTSDPALSRELQASDERLARRVPVDAVVGGAEGRPMRLELSDGARSVAVESAEPLQAALKRPLTPDYLREHVGRLGATPFELRRLDLRLEGAVILPVSRINELRRRAAEALARARTSPPAPRIDGGALGRLRAGVLRETPPASTPRLVVLCRDLAQLDAALAEGVRDVDCDFEDLRKYREAVAMARSRGAWIALAPPRIHKPGEAGILNLVLSCGADALLARSLAHVELWRGNVPLVGDFSLNVANDLAADWFLRRGLDRFVPSYDLSLAQLEALLDRVPVGRAEVVVHQHMPMFHMEHCVIAATLSTGHDASDCGRPCDRHRLGLRDRVGMEHALVADLGCRNTVFNAVAQSASPYVAALRAKGVRWFRAELLRETPADAARLIRGYRELLEGRGDGETLWKELKATNAVGVTRGPLGQ